MPYILKDRRRKYEDLIHELSILINEGENKGRAGDLNYIITALLLKVYKGEWCYAVYNDIIGMLECCKQEFYRRHVAPYEDTKINSVLNGDVTEDD